MYRATGRRDRLRHTFTLAGFEGDDTRAFVVSNFESCTGQTGGSVDDHLAITATKLRDNDRARVIVTGCKFAVEARERRLLVQIAARYPGDGIRVRRRMQALNASAAPMSCGLVSPDCGVVSFRRDGSGALQLTGGGEAPTFFPHVSFGMDVGRALADAFKALGMDPARVRFVGGSFASSRADRIGTSSFDFLPRSRRGTRSVRQLRPE